MKKKVLFAATVFSHLASFHKPFIRWFQEQGYEVHAIGNPDHGRLNELEEMDVICYKVPFVRNPFSWRNREALKILKRLFLEEEYVLIHVHTPVAAFLVRYIAKKYSNSTVLYTAHGFHFYKGAPLLNWLLYYPAEKIASRWTDYLITINEEDYSRGLNLSVRKEVVYVPGVGVEPLRFNNEREGARQYKRMELGVKDEEVVILSVAELNKNKNHEYLLKVIENLVFKRNLKIKVYIVGSGNFEDSLRSIIQNGNLEKIVTLLGFRKDIPELIAASDIFTLLSKREGLPKAIMEAMVVGKPIIASDIRGNRDLVRNKENGFLVPLNDIEKSVEAFLKLYSSGDLRKIMGEKSKSYITKFELCSVEKYMASVYMKALE